MNMRDGYIPQPNTYDHAKRLAIILTNHLVQQEIMMKKEDAKRTEDKKKEMRW